MPIANCYLYEYEASSNQLEALTQAWADEIKVELQDISLTFVEAKYQSGQKYKVMVNLFLPTLWDKASIENIQLALHHILTKFLGLKAEDIFIITTTVSSGNVIENGRMVNWGSI